MDSCNIHTSYSINVKQCILQVAIHLRPRPVRPVLWASFMFSKETRPCGALSKLDAQKDHSLTIEESLLLIRHTCVLPVIEYTYTMQKEVPIT